MTAALVTGAGKRLGRAMALYLAGAAMTWRCTTPPRRPRPRRSPPRSARWGAGRSRLQADLLDEAQTETLVPRAAADLGPLTVLVNNASIFEYDRIDTATRHRLGPAHGIEPARALRADPGLRPPVPGRRAGCGGEPVAQGLIVNMIDQRIWKPTPEFSTYTIAKMGLWALTRTAAQGLAPHIRVNAIGPGPTLQGARQRPSTSPASAPPPSSTAARTPMSSLPRWDSFLDSPA
jgi:NAD(P)-dependent dehydrogenase (short-subunit alcohol dehydrogenase family)